MQKMSLEKIVGKGQNTGVLHFLHFQEDIQMS